VRADTSQKVSRRRSPNPDVAGSNRAGYRAPGETNAPMKTRCPSRSRAWRRSVARGAQTAAGGRNQSRHRTSARRVPVGCTYSISLQIGRIRYAAEFVHPRADRDVGMKFPLGAPECSSQGSNRSQRDVQWSARKRAFRGFFRASPRGRRAVERSRESVPPPSFRQANGRPKSAGNLAEVYPQDPANQQLEPRNT
jgi:hypothetical protein